MNKPKKSVNRANEGLLGLLGHKVLPRGKERPVAANKVPSKPVKRATGRGR